MAIQKTNDNEALAIIEKLIIADTLGNRPDLDINDKEKGTENNALIKAIDFERPIVSEKMLDIHNIDVNAQNKDGFTPLMKAITMKQNKVVDKLLSRPEINIDLASSDNETALLFACQNLDLNSVKRILAKSKATINISTKLTQTTPLIAAIDAMLDFSYETNDGLENSKKAQIEIVKELLRFPILDINHQDNFGDTALSIATLHGEEPIVNALRAFTKINIKDETVEKSGGKSRKQSRTKRRASKTYRKRGKKAKSTRRRQNRRVSIHQ